MLDTIQSLTRDESGLNAGVVAAAGMTFLGALGQTAGAEPEKSSQTKKDDEEIKRLRSKGADYRANEVHWRFMLQAYEGGPDYVSSNTLFKHPREAQEDYNSRLLRAYYSNYCQPLTDFVPEYIFSQDVERKPPTELANAFESFKKNCDRNGTTLNTFMQIVGEDVRIFGMVYIMIDKPARPESAKGRDLSVAEAKNLKVDEPYVLIVRPLEVLDSRVDKFGNLVYLKRIERTIHDTGSDFLDVERYTEWRTDQIKISVIDVSDPKDPKLIQRGTYDNSPFESIPFIPVFFKRSKSNKDVGQSFLQDIAYQNRAVFNQTSLIDEFLYRQCFNILALPKSGNIPFKDGGGLEGNLGTSNVLEYANDATHIPSYIAPSAEPAAFIQKEREQTVREMYRQAAQDVMSEIMNPGRQTGQSQKESFSRTIPVINKTADALQYAEIRMMEMWADVQGKDWKDGKISYKDDYSITNILDMLTQLTMIFNSLHLLSPTFIREEWKRVIREMDGKLDQTTMEKILSEIDSMTDVGIMALFVPPAPMDTVTEDGASSDIKATAGVPSVANLMQGHKQAQLGSDTAIGAAGGTQAATKEKAPDANRRASTPSKPRKGRSS